MKRFIADNRLLSGAIACCTLLCAASAQASITITASFDSYDPGSPWAVTLDGTVHEDTQHGGEFHWSSQSPNLPDFLNGVTGPLVPGPGSTTPVSGGTNFISFCIELTQTIGYGAQGTINVVTLADAPQPGSPGPGILPDSPMGATAASYMATLWANYLDDALQNATDRGAFQLAVWKIAYDEALTFDLSTGRLIASTALGPASSPSVGSIAQGWLNSLTGLGAGNADTLRALTKGPDVFFQDQVVGITPPGSSEAPEPASLLIWGLLTGAIGLAFACRQGS